MIYYEKHSTLEIHMAKHLETGREAENSARDYLVKKGYDILAVNYRYKRNEIDIIASEHGTLVFVEVKARADASFGFPEESVDEKKAERIRMAAEQYIHDEKWEGPIRFDIISVITEGGTRHSLCHFVDAF